MTANIMCPNCGTENPSDALLCQGCRMSLTRIKETFQASMGQLFLCFFGDGPLWDNVVLVPAYPSGYSYFRPFRYRDAWVQPDLLSDMADQQERRTLIGSDAWLCMRFDSDEHRSKLLPMRKVKITHIDYLPDLHSVYFRLGPFYDLGTTEELQQACVEIGEEERGAIGNSLFFRSELVIPNGKLVSKDKEDGMWARFSDLIAKERALPFREETKRALFLRFREPSREKEVARASLIHGSWNLGNIYGSIFSEGRSYELVFFHRIPGLIQTDTSVKNCHIEYGAPTGNVELSVSEEDLTGNYQRHVLGVTALQPSGTWEELVIAPKQESAGGKDGQRVSTVRLEIPFKVKKDLRYRIKRTWLWIMLLALFLCSKDVLAAILGGKQNAALIIGAALSATGAAILLLIIQQKGP